MNTKTLDGEIITNRLDDWRLYQGVRTSRIFAFLIDYVIVFFLCIPVAILIAIIGVATLGLGWILYGIMFPVVALAYVATTLGGPRQATKGMQMMGLKLERLYGQKIDGLLAIVHTVLFCWQRCFSIANALSTISCWAPWSSALTTRFLRAPDLEPSSFGIEHDELTHFGVRICGARILWFLHRERYGGVSVRAVLRRNDLQRRLSRCGDQSQRRQGWPSLRHL
jgi:uncharacterized RDD family membrane protein YckC